MESKTGCLILLTTLLLSCCISRTIAKTQVEAQKHFYKRKALKKNTGGIDGSYFNFIATDEVEIYAQSESSKESDRIERLPGQPPVHFRQYGGYVTVNRTAGRAFYYYFTEAQSSDPKSLPLLLWLNGGPGCSSLAYGAMQELGPFRVQSDGKTLYKNKFAWNHAANVLFLETPAGVGFSYSNTTSENESGGDARTAIDNYAFLVNWLERFPEYKNRDFYIGGESYAGHFVPQLAHIILHHNKAIINLKGIIIGNALINDETDTIGMYEYMMGHAVVSQETTAQIMKHCNFSTKFWNQSYECNSAIDDANDMIGPIDPYNIYGPLCSDSSLTGEPKTTTPSSSIFDPCSEYYVISYFNNPEVQKALHANVTKIPYSWQPCSDVLAIWHDSPSSVIPLHQEFLANGLHVWIFSGDTDGIVPFTSTQESLKLMNLAIKTPWHPWYSSTSEVGGYAQVYEGNLTFATVRGAGHQVPSYQPQRSLTLITHFLDGSELPS